LRRAGFLAGLSFLPESRQECPPHVLYAAVAI
jgi:hypothetical protein